MVAGLHGWLLVSCEVGRLISLLDCKNKQKNKKQNKNKKQKAAECGAQETNPFRL